VYNNCNNIQKTINSVTNQNYKNIEYIIIDGGSTDGTVDVIKENSNYISQWVSEPDNGIYDAMNKGVLLATGEYILFMNCDDIFYNNNALNDLIFNVDKDKYGLIVGGHVVDYGNGKQKIINNTKQLNHKPRKMPYCHQSILAKTELLLKYPFDSNYKIAADFNFLYDCITNDNKIKVKNLVVAVVTANGLSDIKRHETWREYRTIVKKHKEKGVMLELYYLSKLMLESIKLVIKKVLVK